jgi:hypothetical protein
MDETEGSFEDCTQMAEEITCIYRFGQARGSRLLDSKIPHSPIKK